MNRFDTISLCNIKKDEINYFVLFDTTKKQCLYYDSKKMRIILEEGKKKNSLNFSGSSFLFFNYFMLFVNSLLNYNTILYIFILELFLLPIMVLMVLKNRLKESNRIKANALYVDLSAKIICKLYKKGKKERLDVFLLSVLLILASIHSIRMYLSESNAYLLFAVPGCIYVLSNILTDYLPHNYFKLYIYLKEKEKKDRI